MKIVIISDTHDNLNAITAFGEKLKEIKPDFLLHAGDFCAPFAVRAIKQFGIPMKAVFGNNDGDKIMLTQSAEGFAEIKEAPFIFELGTRKFAMEHYQDNVNSLATSNQFEVVIFGHTHKLDIRTQPCLIINPGELCGWLTRRKTAVLLDTDTLAIKIIELT
ncbi:MAG: metallophosphoesterase [bacterium]|nr:metallophosphoesterase [bacterium]